MFQTKRTTTPAVEEILGGYFPVLDHGFISLVDYMGGDEDVERAARVSYGFGTRKTSETRGLIRYLYRSRHTSPFEQVELKFHVAMPIFVARQWVRHRTASLNEYSGRYSIMPMTFFTPDEWRKQSKSNKQGSEGVLNEDGDTYANFASEQTRHLARIQYEALTQADVARELARIDLPLSTYTYWYWKIDLHNLFNFLSLRADPHAQWEIRAYAEKMAGMVQRVAPLAYEAWLDYRVGATSLSAGERRVLADFISSGEGGIFQNPNAQPLDKDSMGNASMGYGLGKREVGDLIKKLQPTTRPDFKLALTEMLPPEHFEERMAAAVPDIDKKAG